MYPEERKLNYYLINQTKTFKHSDFIKYREDRNWEKFDQLAPLDKLRHINKEIKQHVNGYYENDGEY